MPSRLSRSLLAGIFLSFSVAFPLAAAHAQEQPSLSARLAGTGTLRFEALLGGNLVRPTCAASFDISTTPGFVSASTRTRPIGAANFTAASVSVRLKERPVDKRGRQLRTLFARLTVRCPEASSSSSVQKVALKKLRGKAVTATRFLADLTGSAFARALDKARASFGYRFTPSGDEGEANSTSCVGFTQASGPVTPMAWPNPSNTGHTADEGDTVRFSWSGTHNVLELGSFTGQSAPLATLADAGWPLEIRSGPRTTGGAFDWNTGVFPCGYRPGLYYFADEGNPQVGITAVSLNPTSSDHYVARACSTLADPNVLGGRYRAYADRPGCTLYEVNNFQTEPHYDWVPPIFTAKQGDLVLFRWTGEHNVVQVHDVSKDSLVGGGVTSGPKTNCVGGPGYSCVNGSPYLGEYLFDTSGHRPGIVHFSDECAYRCTGHMTGMNMEIDIRYAVPNNTPLPPVSGGCCAYDRRKGKACRLVEITNANEGAQLDYNVPVNRGDLVRFRWSGSLRLMQTRGDHGAPGTLPLPGGLSMKKASECVPGPAGSCLGAEDSSGETFFDVSRAIQKGLFDTRSGDGKILFFFHGIGEDVDGYTSQSTSTIVYVNDEHEYADNPPCD